MLQIEPAGPSGLDRPRTGGILFGNYFSTLSPFPSAGCSIAIAVAQCHQSVNEQLTNENCCHARLDMTSYTLVSFLGAQISLPAAADDPTLRSNITETRGREITRQFLLITLRAVSRMGYYLLPGQRDDLFHAMLFAFGRAA